MKFVLALIALVALASAQTASDYTWVNAGILKTYIIDSDGDYGSKVGDCNVTTTGFSTSSWKGLTNDNPSNSDKAAACNMYTIPEQSRPTPPTPQPTPAPPTSPTPPLAPFPTPRNDGYFFVVGCASAYNAPTPAPAPFAPIPPSPPLQPSPPTPMVGANMVRYFEWGWRRSDCLDDATIIENSNNDGFFRNSDTCIGTNIQSPIMVNGGLISGQVQFRVQCSTAPTPSGGSSSSASSVVPTLFALALALVALLF